MGRKTNIFPIISTVLIFLMIIAIPSFAQFFDGVGDGAGDFFDGTGDGAGDFFDGVGDGGGDFFDGVGGGGDDFFDGVGGGGDDFFDGIDGDGAFDGTGDGFSDSDFEGGAIDDYNDGFDGLDDDFFDDPIDFPDDNTDDGPEFPPESADMRLAITDTPDPVHAGNTITYTITYNNVGYSDAADVLVSFTPDTHTIYNGQLMWSIGTVEPQTQGQFDITVTADSNLAPGTVLTARAFLNYADTATGESYDVSASTGTTVDGDTPPPPPPPPTGANLVGDITDTPDPVRAGHELRYTLTLRNNGDADAEDIALLRVCDDNLVSECSENGIILHKLDPGDSRTFTFNENVKPGVADNTILTTSFRVTYYDPASDDLESLQLAANTEVDNSITPTPGPEPNDPEESSMPMSIKIVSTSFPFTSASGGRIPIYITVKNDGAENLDDTKITIVNQELAIRASAGPFDLNRGNQVTKTLLLDIPEYIPEDTYMLRFTVSSNSQTRRVVYRELDIVPTLE